MTWRWPSAEPNRPGTSTTGAPAPATVTDTDSCGDTASCTTCDESPNNNTASSNIHPSSGRTPPRPRQRVPSLQVLRRGAVTGLTDRAAGGGNKLWVSELHQGRRVIRVAPSSRSRARRRTGPWESQTAPASSRGRDCRQPSVLLHGDRDMHPQRLMRQAVPAVLSGRGAGEGHVVVLVRLREERAYEVAHCVRHPLLESVHRALRHRVRVERDVVRSAAYIDEAHHTPGLDRQRGGLEGGLAGAVAGHLHLDHCRRGRRRSCRGGRGIRRRDRRL